MLIINQYIYVNTSSLYQKPKQAMVKDMFQQRPRIIHIALLLTLGLLLSCQSEPRTSLTTTVEPVRPTMTPLTPSDATPHVISTPSNTPLPVLPAASPTFRTAHRPEPSANITTASTPPLTRPEPFTVAFIGAHVFLFENSITETDPSIYPRLYTINSDGTNLRMLVDFPTSFTLDWSPQGERIAFASLEDSNIYTIRVEGTELEQITNFPERMIVESLSWSPDGRYIAFDAINDIYLANVETGEVQHLIEGRNPDWFSDGHFIMFDLYPEIYKIRPDGSDLECLTCDVVDSAIAPEWWFDTYIRFRGESTFWLMDEEGKKKQLLPPLLARYEEGVWFKPIPFTERYILSVDDSGGNAYLMKLGDSEYLALGRWQIAPLVIHNLEVQP
jgi:hypothetical protein